MLRKLPGDFCDVAVSDGEGVNNLQVILVQLMIPWEQVHVLQLSGAGKVCWLSNVIPFGPLHLMPTMPVNINQIMKICEPWGGNSLHDVAWKGHASLISRWRAVIILRYMKLGYVKLVNIKFVILALEKGIRSVCVCEREICREHEEGK